MRIASLSISPPVVLAPMSGITDTSFRGLCHEAGAGLAYTGLISANALRHGSEKTLGLLSFAPDDHPIAAQLFGADPQIVAAAAAIAVERGADIVDINMGCAVPKVLRAGAGAALLADPPRAEAMARAVVKAAAGHPVSVKMRRGWPDRGEDAASLARRLEQAGAAIIAIHPRWASQGLRGRADWSVITEVKQALSIPVIGNGDVRGPDDARRMLAQTGCDAVMVGRAALGNPWIFSRIGAALRGQPLPAPPTPEDRIAMAARHLHLVIADRGPAVAVREMRKHFAWYLKGLPNAAALRDRANGAKTEAQMQAMLDQAANELAAAATRPSSSGGRR